MSTILDKFKPENFRDDPFPYLVIEDALPWDLYNELDRTRHRFDLYLNRREFEQNSRHDIHAMSILMSPGIPEVWQDFVRDHTSKTFFDRVMEIFGPSVRKAYPFLENLDLPTEVRFSGGTGVVMMECQPGINTPTKLVSRVRGPHLDNPVELIGGLLYMRDPSDSSEGGDYQICRFRPEVEKRWHGKLELGDECVNVVDTVPYKPNMLAMFMNSPESVHSVSPRQVSDLPRRIVNFAIEFKNPLFRVGHGRY